MYKKVDSKLLQIGNNVREYRKQKHYNQEKIGRIIRCVCCYGIQDRKWQFCDGYFDSYEYFKDIRTAN